MPRRRLRSMLQDNTQQRNHPATLTTMATVKVVGPKINQRMCHPNLKSHLPRSILQDNTQRHHRPQSMLQDTTQQQLPRATPGMSALVRAVGPKQTLETIQPMHQPPLQLHPRMRRLIGHHLLHPIDPCMPHQEPQQLLRRRLLDNGRRVTMEKQRANSMAAMAGAIGDLRKLASLS